MKSASKKSSNIAPSDSSVPGEESSRSLSGQQRKAKSIRLHQQSRLRGSEKKKSSAGSPVVYLSKSIEKSFLRLKNRTARRAYVEAELVNGMAHQIRILRQQRDWTQALLARKLKTTQAVVSRLEDPSYGRYSIKTLLEVGRAFDVALFVRYFSFTQFILTTWNTQPDRFRAAPYDEEASQVEFFEEKPSRLYVGKNFFGQVLAPGGAAISVDRDKPKHAAVWAGIYEISTSPYLAINRPGLWLGQFDAAAPGIEIENSQPQLKSFGPVPGETP